MKKAIQNSSEILQKFYCDKCDYSCSRRGDFNKHVQSVKHNATLSYKNATENSYTCDCGKNYKHSSSFYRHKKICNYEPPKSMALESIFFIFLIIVLISKSKRLIIFLSGLTLLQKRISLT